MKVIRCLFCSASAVLVTTVCASAACNIVNGVAYGDCSGVTVNTQTVPFKTVAGSESISGLSEGAQVLAGGALLVSGMADRVIVDAGGSATVSGIVSVLEVAGTAKVTGQVDHLRLVAGGRAMVEGVVGTLSGVGTVQLAEGAVLGGSPTTSPKTLSLGQ